MSDVATHSTALAPQLAIAGVSRLGSERLVRGGLVLLLVAAAFSGIVDFAAAGPLLAILTACLAVAMAIRAGLDLLSRRMPVRPVGAAILLVAIAGLWMVVQLSPIAPASWQHPLWSLAAPVLGDAAHSIAPRITIAPDAGFDAIIALLRDVLVFWIAYGLAATTVGARRLLTAVAIIGIVTALATLSLALGIAPITAAASGAGVAGLGIVALFALWVERRSRPGATTPAVAGARRRAGLLQAAPLAAIVVVAGAVVATDSLGGLLVALIGLFGSLLAVMLAPGLAQFRHRAGIALPLGTAFIGGSLLVGVPIAIHWITGTAVPDGGAGTIALALQAIGDAPLLGTGAGAGPAVMRLYGAPGMPGAFLTAMIELGIPAALVLVLGCAALFGLATLGVWRRRRNVVYACVGIGATLLVAGDAVAGPSLCDPAISLIWCVLMGIACAQALRSDERRAGGAPA
jgi:hypothetical protein